MKCYESFASYYDDLTQNIDYNKLAKYFKKQIEKYGNGGNILLDLACGTGSLSIELAKCGFDVVGVDASEEMLSVAMNKNFKFGNPIFLNQTMQNLDMFGTIDVVVCSLDSINHIKDEKDVVSAFERVSLFLNPEGLFIFDVNTLYKHKNIIGNNTFVYDTDNVYCVWQNTYNEENFSVDIHLDFFSKLEKGIYERDEEHFSEYYYCDEFLLDLINKTGLKLIAKYDDFSENEVNNETQRIVYVCRKEKV